MINLVADLSICQEAFKKGIKIESKFYWSKHFIKYDGDNKKITGYHVFPHDEIIDSYTKNKVPAPLTDEILQVLPFEVISQGISEFLTIYKEGENYRVGYGDFKFYDITDKKLSNALLSLVNKLFDEKII